MKTVMIMNIVTISADGTDSHNPLSPMIRGSNRKAGMTKTIPLRRE